MGDRATGISDSYANFRLKSFRFRLHPNGQLGAAGFLVGSANTTPPSTVTTLMEIIPALICVPDLQIMTNWVVVPKTDLAGPLPWYKTQTVSGNDEFPGFLVNVGASMFIEYFATIEFKGAVDPANTPAYQEFRRKVRDESDTRRANQERDRLLLLLAAKGNPTPTRGPQ